MIRKTAAVLIVGVVLLSTFFENAIAKAPQQSQQPLGEQPAHPKVQEHWEQVQRLRRDGKLALAIQAAKEMLERVRSLYSRPSRDLVISLELLAVLQEANDDFAAAMTLREEVLAIRAKAFGKTDWRTIDAQVELKNLQIRRQLSPEQRQRLAEAEQLAAEARQALTAGERRKAVEIEAQVLKVRRELLGKDHPDVASSYSNLALIYSDADVLHGAERYYREAVRIRERHFGVRHPKYAIVLQSLADVLRRRGQDQLVKDQFSKAISALSEALAIRASQHGINDSRTRDLRVDVTHAARLAAFSPEQRNELKRAAKLQWGAVQFYKEEKYEQALAKSDQALAISRKLLGDDDPTTLISVRDSGIIAAWLGQEAKARTLFREVVRTRWSLYGPNHKTTRDSMKRLADHLEQVAQQKLQQDQFDEAIRTHREILPLRASLLGKNHWRVGDARRALEYVETLAGLTDKQRKDLKTADELHQAALSLHAEGRFHEAISPCQQALDIREIVLGDEHPSYATSLNNLALLYQLTADFAKAESFYEQSLRLRQKVLGDEHPVTAASLNDLAHLYNSQGDFAKAELLYQQVIDVRKRVLGEHNAEFAVSLKNLALLYDELGNFAKAEPLLLRAQDIMKRVRGEEHPDYGMILNNLARIYYAMGDYGQAEPLYRQALDIAKKGYGEEHPNYAATLNNLALLYLKLGDYSRAERLLREALDINKKVLGKEHPDYVNALSSLAGIYWEVNDYARAETLLREARDITKKALGEEHLHYAERLQNLAVMYDSMGDYKGAEPLYRQALDIIKRVLGKEHPKYATGLNNLALLYQSMGHYTKAEPLHRHALEILKKALGEEHPQYAASLASLAGLYYSISDYAKAESLQRQALDIRKKVLGEQHPHYAVSLNNLSWLYRSMGDYAKAEPLARRALMISRDLLENTALVQSERQQLAMAEGLRYQLDNYLSLAINSEQNYDQAFRQVLGWKGATLVRQRQMRKVAENADVVPLFKKLQQTATRLATLSRITPDSDEHEVWQRQITNLTAEKERLEAELSEKSSAYRDAKKQVTLEDIVTALPKDAALVDFLEYWQGEPESKDAQKPHYFRSLLAFVIRSGKPVVLLELGPVAPVSESVDTWRRTFGTSRDGVAAGRFLREQIWEPVEEHLDGTKLLLVSADGTLGRLPLAALAGKKDGSYLLEDYRLAMLPVPQLLPTLVSELGRKELTGGLLLLGDVDYDADPDSQPRKRRPKSWKRSSTALVRGADLHFSRLQATAGELATIKELFTDLFDPAPSELETLKRAAATEQQFRDSAPRFYNLHLATHGFFAEPDKKSALEADADEFKQRMLSLERNRMIRGFNPGLLSGLAFSGANRKPEPDKDDGILTADEIASLSLDGVDLVVLSACETGLGEVAGGEGLLGVQRAFQVAGARSTVASLWEVGDVATRRLMERFYRNYWDKEMSKLDSLREAQLYLLNHPEAVRGDRRVRPQNDEEPKRLSPQLWAAFQLSGDWR